MSHYIVDRFNNVFKEVNSKKNNCKIIAVSKTFAYELIEPLLNQGHFHFGENKVQEAILKWKGKKNIYQNLQLHMIGKLQTNKVKLAVQLFDYIHSLDNIRLAEKISLEQKKIEKKLKIFIQVNIGSEAQKSGIYPENLKNFYNECIGKFDLNIIGLMCIPPISKNVKIYFNQMAKLNEDLNLNELSMGMSSDYVEAIESGASYVRIGSKIFGDRIK